MKKGILLYPLGDIDGYKEITYVYKLEKIMTELPVSWLADKIGNVEEIMFVITEELKRDYFSLFRGLCKLLLKKDIGKLFDESYLNRIKKRENFDEDKDMFLNYLREAQNCRFKYNFLIIDENNLLSFFKELKQCIEEHLDYIIHIDITHSYRFVSMFAVVAVLLLRWGGKNVEVGEILYAFAKDDVSKVISLKDYADTLSWSNAIYSFNNLANTLPIAEVLDHPQFSSLLHTLQQSLDMNLTSKIRESISNLRNGIEKVNIKNEIFNQLVLNDLKKVLSGFVLDKNQSDFEVSLTKWHLNNKRYLHGYTALIETMITRVCESYKLNVGDRNHREMVKCIFLSIRDEYLTSYQNYQRFIENNIKSNKKLDVIQKKMSILFDELSNIRNTFAHIKITDVMQSENIYRKAKEFAESFNPLVFSKKTFSSLDEVFMAIDELPQLLNIENLIELSNIYKSFNKGVV